MRLRLDGLLEKLGTSGKAEDRLRSQRVVAVLELAGTGEARELLEHLEKKGGVGGHAAGGEGGA